MPKYRNIKYKNGSTKNTVIHAEITGFHAMQYKELDPFLAFLVFAEECRGIPACQK